MLEKPSLIFKSKQSGDTTIYGPCWDDSIFSFITNLGHFSGCTAFSISTKNPWGHLTGGQRVSFLTGGGGTVSLQVYSGHINSSLTSFNFIGFLSGFLYAAKYFW